MPRLPKTRTNDDTHFPSFELTATKLSAQVSTNGYSPLLALVTRLSEMYGPSGSEERVRDLVRDEIKGYVDQVRVDAMGNLIAWRRGNGSTRKKVMLTAHLDEIGVMITHIDAQGFCRFGSLGSVKPLTLLGQRVQFANGAFGVLGREEQDASRDEIELDSMFIDVSAAGTVQVGDAACFYREFRSAGNFLIGKALDDRIGCAVLIETARQLKKTTHDLYFVFTVQEEVGARGAQVAAFSIQPEIAFAVDATHTGDMPGAEPLPLALGKGPAIKVKDAGMVTNSTARQLLINAARDAHVTYQLEVMPKLTTDAMSVQAAREGVPTGVLSIPMRYMHTPSEMVYLEDAQNSIRVLTTVLSKNNL